MSAGVARWFSDGHGLVGDVGELATDGATPPRHLARNDQDEKITHWLSGTIPWDAADPT